MVLVDIVADALGILVVVRSHCVPRILAARSFRGARVNPNGETFAGNRILDDRLDAGFRELGRACDLLYHGVEDESDRQVGLWVTGALMYVNLRL